MQQEKKYIPIHDEDHDRIIKGQTDGLSLEMAIYNAGYERGKAQHPAGCEWVKATDKLPGWGKYVKWRHESGKELPGQESVHSITDRDRVSLHGWEWYDENPSKEGKKEREGSSTEMEKAKAWGDWISVEDKPLIRRDGEWWELTEDGEREFIAAVQFKDASTKDPEKIRWWIRHCYIDGDGCLYVKSDNDMDEDVAGWSPFDITYWMPIPEPPKQQKG